MKYIFTNFVSSWEWNLKLYCSWKTCDNDKALHSFNNRLRWLMRSVKASRLYIAVCMFVAYYFSRSLMFSLSYFLPCDALRIPTPYNCPMELSFGFVRDQPLLLTDHIFDSYKACHILNLNIANCLRQVFHRVEHKKYSTDSLFFSSKYLYCSQYLLK